MNHILFTSFLMVAQLLVAQSLSEREVAIGDLKGTLSTPTSETQTAILLIAGSGPTDRDGNSAMGFKSNSLKMLAQQLSESGYAVLRFDKRGIGGSKAAVTDPTSVRFEHFVTDASDWLQFLSDQGYSKLVVMGHSQGSLVGMMAAQQSDQVVGFVSIAGLSEDAGEAIVRQLGAEAPALAEDARINIDSMKAGYTVKKFNPFLLSLFGPAIQPFLKSYIAYDPQEEIQKLSIPVLLVNGTTDLQVGEDQARQLNEAYPEADLLIIEGMNHVLKDAPADRAENLKTYNNPDLPLSDGLVTGVLQFLNQL